MKKLMIAAAAAAMVGGAYAATEETLCNDLCHDETATPKCFVWVFRANVKTLLPAKVTVKTKTDDSSICYDGVTPGSTCKYLVAGVRQFVGLAWLCESVCPAQDIHDGKCNFVAWENSSKLPITKPLEWDGTVFTADVIPEADEEAVLFDRFGIQGKAVEAFWPLELDGITLGAMSEAEQEKFKQYVGAYGGDLYLAGFGALPSRLTAANFAVINGYCVANWQPECGPTKPEFCEDITSWCAEDDATNVAGYGIWSLTYSSAYSSGTYSLRRIVPARAQVKAE